jgi:AraC-like DNA-binding protein
VVGPPPEKLDYGVGNSTSETTISAQGASTLWNQTGIRRAVPGCTHPLGWPFGCLAAGAIPLHQASANSFSLPHSWQLARVHLRSLFQLLQELTGLSPGVVWAPVHSDRWAELELLRYSGVCRSIAGNSEDALARCQACAAQHFSSTLLPGGFGHQFTCCRGVRNCLIPIEVRHCTVGIAFVQALDHSLGGPDPGEVATSAPAQVTSRPSGGARSISRPEFERVARVLQLICEYVQAVALADLWRTDLDKVQQELPVSAKSQPRPNKELVALPTAFHPSPSIPASGSHGEWLMHHLLERLDQDYVRPITLKQCACALGLNAAYLSTLFSRVVGMPFKAYLTELRMEKAQEFLSDPARTVSEVAYSVGYASENRFRNAFKKAIGLPPRIWRETVRMSRSALLVWLLDDLDFLDGLGALFLG